MKGQFIRLVLIDSILSDPHSHQSFILLIKKNRLSVIKNLISEQYSCPVDTMYIFGKRSTASLSEGALVYLRSLLR